MKTPVGKLDPQIKTVHIWGGGVAGLLMGHFLSRAGFTIELYEKSDRVGGKIQSFKTPDGIMESGPNAIYATAEIEEWLRSLGLTPLFATEKLKRRLWNGKPLKPLTPLSALTLLPKLFTRAPHITEETNLATYFRPLLGTKVEELLSPALQGIYACGAEQLTITSMWPQMPNDVSYFKALRTLKGAKARSVSFAGGMQEFVEALAKTINGRIHLNYHAPFELRPNTIICADAPSASELLKDAWPAGARELTGITYLPVTSVTMKAPRLETTKQTFGYLFPRSSGINALGVLFNQEIFPHRTGMTFIFSGVKDIPQRLEHDLQKLHWKLDELKVHSWTKGLPLYDYQRVRAIRSLDMDPTRPKELIIFGNYVAGISLRDMIQIAKTFSLNVQDHRE